MMVFASLVILLLTIVFFILAYIPFSFGIYQMASKQGLDMPWLAFIPLAQLYIVGLIVREIRFQSYQIPQPQLVLPLAVILGWIVNRIPLINLVYSLALCALMILTTYRLYSIYKRDSAMLFTVLSLIPIVGSILILVVSQYEPDYTTY